MAAGWPNRRRSARGDPRFFARLPRKTGIVPLSATRHGFCLVYGGMETYVGEPVGSTNGRLARRALHAGVEGLGDAELLALLLAPTRRQANGSMSASAILEALGGLEGLGRAGPYELGTLCGLDASRCLRVAAAFELGRRTLERLSLDDREVMGSLDSVVRWARPRLAPLDHEQVWLLVLDGRNRLKSVQRVAQGGLHGCALTPGDVLRPAVRDAGSAIVLVHNHPSGDPEPSPEDLVMTRRVATAGELLGVPLLDHVIVARNGESSLFELGALGH